MTYICSITKNKNKNTMKNIKQGTKEIKVTDRIQGSYSIRNNKLLIYKGYRSNIYYLTYDNVVIMTEKNITTLLFNFEDYINTFDGLDNQLRAITDEVNEPLYYISNPKTGETVSIYKVLEASDTLELLETSEINGGRYAIHNKEEGHQYGLSYEAAINIFNNN